MKTILISTLIIISTSILFGQEIKIGFKDSIQSEILNESRKIIINLPKSYNSSDKTYPVIYRLDGSIDFYTETVGIVNRLTYMEELTPEMIVVMIENTNRNRDMMPTNTSFFKSEPGAENFKKFIETELIPHINNTFRTNNENILCGQSLSAVFTMYCFLTNSGTFDTYIACSGGFPGCEEYFGKLTDEFLKIQQTKKKKLFLTHGLKDFLDPNGIIKEQLLNFTKSMELKENINYQLKIYEDEGHVPFQSLYHGLKFVYETKTEK